MTDEERDGEVKLADCRFYFVELREVRGSGPLALMERDWCERAPEALTVRSRELGLACVAP